MGVALLRPLLRDLIREPLRELTRDVIGGGVDNLLVSDTGDHYLIDDTNTDVRKVQD